MPGGCEAASLGHVSGAAKTQHTVLSPVVWCCVESCCVVLCCVVLRCMVWCSVCVPSVRAGGVLFKTRTQYQRVLGITLAEVPTTVLG